MSNNQPMIDPKEKVMRDGLALFAERVKAAHEVLGYWDDAEHPEDVDISNVIAAIHRGLSKAYDTYTQGGDPRRLFFADPRNGQPTPIGKGAPIGFSADMADVIFDCMGLLRLLGLDVVEVLTSVVEGQIALGQMPDEEEPPKKPQAAPQTQTK